ncbi:MAG TPA: ketohexokinase [Gammaproteobacteria bacterium]|nr:ketohexokinase [Gammaproteobacteria bacterium]
MARILAVGIVALDIISEVESYPAEDSEIRALSLHYRRGGNAANTLVVLGQLGHDCEWAGTWVKGPEAAIAMADLEANGIAYRYARCLPRGRLPTSCVLLSRAGGSRTIVHYRELPEFEAGDFSAVPLEGFDWIHFEGRNVAQTRMMMQQARARAPRARISLEAEKAREGMESLFPLADVILFSRDFARASGLSPKALLARVRGDHGARELVCALGEEGAIALDRRGRSLYCEAVPPAELVDTLGAGDTFNAGVIDALSAGVPLARALQFATRLAGLKCAQSGLANLRIPPRSYRPRGRGRP